MNPETVLQFNPDYVDPRENCKAEVYDQKKFPWDEIRENILDIELSAFGKEKAFDEEMLKRDFEHPESTVILARGAETNKIIGFTYAMPTAIVYPEDYPDRRPNENTAYICDSAFDKSYRGKGLISPTIEELEKQLAAKGFSFVERDSANY
jgi:ribosomal protein S18 acetylase RimI-like enzyme